MEIVCTIGPATFNRPMIRMLGCAGVTVFRLNLSHTQSLEDIETFKEMVDMEVSGRRTCLDTHGMKYSLMEPETPVFTEFDISAMAMIKELGIDQVAVSYASSEEVVNEGRELSGNAFTVAKIESLAGYRNMTRIIDAADAVLIDRGDLARSVSIIDVPAHCREIITTCKGMNTPVWVATNLLESMVNSPIPTAAEVNDIASLVMMGIDGLVLAAETAIGKYPIQCVEFVRDMAKRYKSDA